VDFEVLGEIANIEVIAEGRGVRIKRVLRRMHGGRRWRKMKGDALVRFDVTSTRNGSSLELTCLGPFREPHGRSSPENYPVSSGTLALA